MKNMKKVEVIIESVYEHRLIELFKKYDISGYTIIKDIEGYGGHGLKTADDVSDVFRNFLIFTVCEEEKYQKMDSDIRSFLNRYGGKCILSDVMLLLGKPKN
jgi:nitrogen regulatory protein PII